MELRADLRRASVAFVLVVVGAGTAAAQQVDTARAQQACRSVLQARGVPPGNDPCFVLAALVEDSLSSPLLAGEVQASTGGTAEPVGSPAQSSAVPTVQPTALVSALVSETAQDSVSTAITVISVNPAMLFSGTSDPGAIARLSRLLDLTLFVPLGHLDDNKDGRLDYAGARLRVNLTAPWQARRLLQDFNERMRRVMRASLNTVNEAREVLLRAPDADRCVGLLVDATAEADSLEAACGTATGIDLADQVYAEVRRAAATAREQADAKYFGLDLRYETGDPSLGKVHNAAGRALVVALAAGDRFRPTSPGGSAEVRGHLGLRHVQLQDTALSDWQFDAGVEVAVSRLIEQQRLRLSVGIECRTSGNRDATQILQTRFAAFRGGLQVPLSDGTSLVVSGSVPLTGEVSPTISVGGNWQQLLRKLFPAGGA